MIATGLPPGTVCRDPHCGRPMVSQRPRVEVPDGFVVHQGRGLCTLCHFRHGRDGTRLDFPRSTVSWDDTLTDWDTLRRQGATRVEAAARIGVSAAALDKVIERGLDRGDPRAVWAPRSRHHNSIRAARQAVAENRRGWTRASVVA